MERQAIETLSGVGEIYAADRLLRRTTYHLDVANDESRPTATVLGGTIDITGMAEALVLAGPEQLTLRLEDGRMLPFALGSSAGRIEARGGLPAAPIRQSAR